MTMVAVARFSDATLIIADSRGTWTDGRREMYEDRLQKIIPVGRKAVVAFAGSASVAAQISDHLNREVRRRNRLESPRRLLHELPRIARHYFHNGRVRTKSRWPLSLILSGASGNDIPRVWRFDSPEFRAHEINEWDVIGTGDKAASYLKDNYDSLKHIADPRERCDHMRDGLTAALRPHNEMTVGGMFQALILTPEGTRPINYRYLELNPYQPPKGRSMSMEGGRWVQRDLITSDETPLEHPSTLVSRNPRPIQTEDYLDWGSPSLRWHLSHFITCIETEFNLGTAEFRGVLSAIGSSIYPRRVSVLAALAFWGPAGTRRLTYRLVCDDRDVTVFSKEIEVLIFPEEFETVDEIELSVERPGLHFVECWIDGFRLSRRAFFFGRVDDQGGDSDAVQNLGEELIAEMSSQTDSLIQEESRAEVVYHTLCRGSTSDGMLLRFDRQFVAAYWRDYPANIPVHVATGLRLPPGERSIELALVSAQTGHGTTLAEFSGTASSTCTVTPIEGDLVIPVPRAGLYYLNVLVDKQLTATALVAFETDKPEFMYSLDERSLSEVREGALLYLQKRSKQQQGP